MIPVLWLINAVFLLLLPTNCEAYVNGWKWEEHLPGFHCMGVPVTQDTVDHLGITWEHYVVNKNDWQVGDLPPLEIYLPKKGMRIFRGFTYRALHNELISPYPLKPVPYNADDYKVAFFVLGLYDSCTLEQIYSSGTLFMWSPRQFKHEHDCANTKEYMEKLATKFTAEGCDVSLEHYPSSNVQLSLTIMSDTPMHLKSYYIEMARFTIYPPKCEMQCIVSFL